MKKNRKPFSTKYFTWLHVPKTGGTWLYALLRRHKPPSWDATNPEPAHVRLAELPDMLPSDRMGLPVIAGARNPWDWWVSLYFFMEQHYTNRTGGFAAKQHQWTAGQKQWAKTFSKGNNIEGFRKALPVLVHAIHEDENYAVARPQEHFLRLRRGPLTVRVTRFENLREETLRAIEETGAPVPKTLCDAVMKSRPTNQSGHCHYAHCYTPSLRALVDRNDRWVIRQVGYRFEESP